MPSPTAMREYLELFHDEDREKLRVAHRAFIPAAKKPLDGLVPGQYRCCRRWLRRAGETSSYRKRLESRGSTNVLCSRGPRPISQVPQLP